MRVELCGMWLYQSTISKMHHQSQRKGHVCHHFPPNEAVKEQDNYGLVRTTKEILMILFLWLMLLLLHMVASTYLSGSHDTHPLSPATASHETSALEAHPSSPRGFESVCSEALLLHVQVAPDFSLLEPL